VSGVSKKQVEATFENPLIPHAKLRQIYVAMLRSRLLEKALPASRRGRGVGVGAVSLGIAGLEACLVSPAISLEAGDLIGDAVSGGVVDFLRGAALGEVFRKPKKKGRSLGLLAGCGAAAALAAAPTAAERLWAATGAALALKSANEAARKNKLASEVEEPVEPKQNLVVVYVRPGEAAASVWSSVLRFAADQLLPMLFVVLPPVAGGKASGISSLSQKCGVPGIPVDGSDAVAIYRVAQESVVRARMGGGPALIECVPYVVEGSKAKASDGIAGLERYMLERGVVTREWVEREAKGFAKRVAGAKATG
jgi:TPP-dependent pyruvate/acetoin dehydrogenase alpha subunit